MIEQALAMSSPVPEPLKPIDVYRAALLGARLRSDQNELTIAAEAVWNAAIDAAASRITELTQLKAVLALRTVPVPEVEVTADEAYRMTAL